MDKVHRINSVEWSPSPVVALATSADSSQVAAARADGSLEIWLVSPGSVGWHCQLTIHGDPNSRVSSLVWCQSGPRDGSLGRLLSSSIDGSISEWDLFDLRQKKVLDPIGISLWQIAAEPSKERQEMKCYENGRTSPSITSDVDDEEENNESEDDGDDDDDVYSVQIHEQDDAGSTRIAVACDDGCVRIYSVSDAEKLVYNKTLPRVGGRTLSVAWSSDANRIFSGNSDGLIRCWDVNFAREVYRITIGQGGLHSGNELCIWSLLALRCGTIVSGDSSGGVQFWDGQFGTPLQAHSYHKGDVNALAAAPNHDRVFSAGADGQIIQYKLSSEAVGSGVEKIVRAIKKWIYVGYVRAHTHDVRALTVAVPISHEDLPPDVKVKRARGKKKPLESTSHKWAHSDVPMLISAGDDAKLFAYSVKEFTKFSPHDICPAPQRMPMQLVLKTLFNQTPLLLVQSAHFLDIFSVRLKTSGTGVSSSSSGSLASTDLVARIRCKDSRKIICSTISSSGALFAYSDQLKPNLFELKRKKSGNRSWSLNKRRLPKGLPYAHFMVFSSDSSRLILAGEDRRIYVADVASPKLVHAFTPSRKDNVDGLPPSEPPITKMFTDNDGKWLAAVNCHGDVYIFNLETLRQHWFVSRLDGASVTAGGFTPANSNILVISTSSNQVYALHVEAKKLGEWSMRRTFSLPRRYQELPGEVIGLSFQPSSSSSSVIVYSPRAMCTIDFETPAGKDDNTALANCKGLTDKVNSNGVLKRKLHDLESNHGGRNNSEFSTFRDPVLFVEHLSKNSLLVIDKPWSQVVNTFEAKPVHRHIFGT